MSSSAPSSFSPPLNRASAAVIRSLDHTLTWLLSFLFMFALFLYSLYPAYIVPYFLSLFSGFSTVFGGYLVVHRSSPLTSESLSFACGLAAGVMCFVGLLDFLLSSINSGSVSLSTALLSFAIGSVLMWLAVDRFPDAHAFEVAKFVQTGAPNSPNREREPESIDPESGASAPLVSRSDSSSLSAVSVLRFSLLSAMVLAAHNAPEGLAVFLSSVDSPRHGIRTAIALSLHNLPEGLVVATPLYFLTQNRALTIKVTLLSGLTEPLGAVLSFFLSSMSVDLTESRISVALCFVAGLMVTVSIKELIPEGIHFHGVRTMSKGVVLGLIIMAIAKWVIGDD